MSLKTIVSFEGLFLFKKVLAAIDGTEASTKILDFALELSEKFDASLTILNVSEAVIIGVAPEESTNYPGANMSAFAKDLEKLHGKILSKAVAYAKEAKPSLSVSSMLREGDPADEIVNAAEEENFDAVVIGHQAVGRVKELFLGGISEKIVHLAPCSVIIVK